MKKFTKYFIICWSLFIPVLSFADWNVPDKGYFTSQVITSGISQFQWGLASINFNGQVFSFQSFWAGGNLNSQISLYKMSNTSGTGINLTMTKAQAPVNLQTLAKKEWQPATVVFHNQLYLFVLDKDKQISYSVYNSGADSWSSLVKGPLQDVNFMSAVVLNDKLCLIVPVSGSDNHVRIYWTTDLVSWSHFDTDLLVHSDNYFTSAILRAYMDNGSLKSDLMVGYIDGNLNARCGEFSFDTLNNISEKANTLISADHPYTAVALCQGSVKGDKVTKGNVVQAFPVLKVQEDNFGTYRIQRYQFSNGLWSLQENNLVKQNYFWALSGLNTNTTALNVPLADHDTIRQFMCLIYFSAHGLNTPLNCAWAETDHLVNDTTGSVPLTGSENTQYVGYIEGPPPFYKNDIEHNPNPYVNQNAHVSDLDYINTVSASNSTSLGFNVGESVEIEGEIFKTELGYTLGKKWGFGFAKTVTNSTDVIAGPDKLSYYITFVPTLNYARYRVYDVNNTYLYNNFYFFMSEPEKGIEMVDPIPGGLVPSNPLTYMNRGINFSAYDKIGKDNVPWANQLGKSGHISVDSTAITTTSGSLSLKLSALAEILGMKVEGKLSYEMTTTTLTGDEITCNTRMNHAFDSTDVTELNYDYWWLKPTQNKNNWWLHPGVNPNQKTWCVTYDVTHIKYKNGTVVNAPREDENTTGTGTGSSTPGSAGGTSATPGNDKDDGTFSIDQNSPNPFATATKFRYHVGRDINNPGSADERYPTRITVYSVSGNVVAKVLDELKAPGHYELNWNASGLAAGIYFYEFLCGNHRKMKKMVIIN